MSAANQKQPVLAPPPKDPAKREEQLRKGNGPEVQHGYEKQEKRR